MRISTRLITLVCFIFVQFHSPNLVEAQKDDWKINEVVKAEHFLSTEEQDSAFYYLTEAEKIYQASNNDSALALLNRRVATLFRQLKKYDQALTRIDKSIKYFKFQDSLRWANAELTRANIQLGLRNSHESDISLRKVEEINVYLKDCHISVLVAIHKYYRNIKANFPGRAMTHVEEAYRLASQCPRADVHVNWTARLLSSEYMENGRLESALELLHQAWRTRDSLNQKVKYLILRDIGKTHDRLGNIDSALYYLKLYAQEYSKWVTSDREKHSTDLIQRYENQLKNERIVALKTLAENNSERIKWLILALILLFTTVIIGCISWVQLKKNNQKDKLLLESANEQLRNESKLQNLESMIEGQESERKRFARELHDALGGGILLTKLAAQKMKGNDSEEYKTLIKSIDDNIAQVRYISKDLSPQSLEKYGLETAIAEYVERVQKLTSCTFEIQVLNPSFRSRFGSDAELNLFRCVQEIVTNCVRHAQAQEVHITLHHKPNGLTLSIEDDGIGFDKNTTQSSQGLNNIQMRCKFIGAQSSVETEPEKGSLWVINYNS